MSIEQIQIDDQPISSTFFGQGKWLTEFVTPDNGDIQRICKQIYKEDDPKEVKARACWYWVAHNVRYVPFVKATLTVEGKTSRQIDYWAEPSLTLHTRVANCANKAFLLASLLRNFEGEDQVKCVLGNLYQNNTKGGHAWVEILGADGSYIMESTRDDVPPFIPAEGLAMYEPVIYFNDKGVSAVPDRTLLVPFSAVYADWLSDYLNKSVIRGVNL
ncbi:MAG: transglutaminase domain-containing protein [Candidatus Marinimicrobia bacterium]|nr:transglutaminase domain-containing protein [Candidatus Neomarinimicrobiota bacterium]MDD5539126.1 transglutaminase domain-containing protein [Candidatus Neomarinimicrobiota bacterium]